MNDVKRILVASRMIRYSRKAVHYGVSLSKKYNAELYVIHVVYNPFLLKGWNLALPSLEREYAQLLQRAKEELDKVISSEKEKGMDIEVIIKEGEPSREIMKVIKEKEIDLLIMLSHKEAPLEHYIYMQDNEKILRELPCSILLVKKEPGPIPF